MDRAWGCLTFRTYSGIFGNIYFYMGPMCTLLPYFCAFFRDYTNAIYFQIKYF